MKRPFDSPRLLIDEAEEYITRIETGAKAFIYNQGNTGGIDVHPKTREKLLYVQFPTDIPTRISMDVRVAARELRDALDHAVYASAVTLLGGDPKRTKFLVADEASGISDDIKRGRCKDVHEEIIAIMVNEAAHKTGNRTLWALNNLRNNNTHKVVSLANTGAHGFDIVNGTMDGTISTMSEWRSTRRRLYFVRFSPDSKFDFQASPTIDICLQKVYGFGDEPVTEVLRRALGHVRRIVEEIEAATSRILVAAI